MGQSQRIEQSRLKASIFPVPPAPTILGGYARHVSSEVQATGTKKELDLCPVTYGCGLPT